jgi:hypothetical protein
MENLFCASRKLLETRLGLIVEIAFSGRFGLEDEGNVDAHEMSA